MSREEKKKKEEQSKEHRVKLYLTVAPETYKFIKENGINASRFFDNAIYALRTNSEQKTILITTAAKPDSEKKMDPAGFEPAASTLRT